MIKPSSKLGLIFSIIIWGILLTSCVTYLEENITVGIDKSYSHQDIEKAIILSAKSNGWNLKKSSKGKVVAALTVRNHKIITDILYQPGVIVAQYDDSYNMDYSETPNGKVIHKNYHEWVNDLLWEIKNNLDDHENL